ncbi:Fibropellin-1 [Trichoplax sp. H2]|nr:Fibropellin-1 [Trichoplax sp. H2]|eukprot:RDD38412.1 Fibropellin-1 [Trichoplax sp. H2]
MALVLYKTVLGIMHINIAVSVLMDTMEVVVNTVIIVYHVHAITIMIVYRSKEERCVTAPITTMELVAENILLLIFDIIFKHNLDAANGATEGQLHLSGGTTSGRLEIYHHGTWGTVCNPSFGWFTAKVACRQLGFSAISNYGYLPNTHVGSIWPSNVTCTDYESPASCFFNTSVNFPSDSCLDIFLTCYNAINECHSSRCRHNGTCTDNVDGYACNCLVGYTGNQCETNINECSSNPCLYGGTCQDQIDSYRCNCPFDRTGIYCETDIDECQSSPCRHNGTCTNNVDSYACNCLVGYTGNQCETNINECSSNPCLYGGTCQDQIDSYRCNCPFDRTGIYCETDITECQALPCQNNGTCTENMNDYKCNCPLGYSGDQCETNINECSSNPCLHDGTCHDQTNGYTCICPFDRTGIYCETDGNICRTNSSLCKNGGICIALGVYNYTCNCTVKTYGNNCQYEISRCASNPCQHEYATCTDQITGYICKCPPEVTGTFCGEVLLNQSSQEIVIKKLVVEDENCTAINLAWTFENMPNNSKMIVSMEYGLETESTRTQKIYFTPLPGKNNLVIDTFVSNATYFYRIVVKVKNNRGEFKEYSQSISHIPGIMCTTHTPGANLLTVLVPLAISFGVLFLFLALIGVALCKKYKTWCFKSSTKKYPLEVLTRKLGALMESQNSKLDNIRPEVPLQQYTTTIASHQDTASRTKYDQFSNYEELYYPGRECHNSLHTTGSTNTNVHSTKVCENLYIVSDDRNDLDEAACKGLP